MTDSLAKSQVEWPMKKLSHLWEPGHHVSIDVIKVDHAARSQAKTVFSVLVIAMISIFWADMGVAGP